MSIQQQLAQIEVRIEQVQTEIADNRYFVATALCKETKGIYRLTLKEKQKELQLLFSHKQELLDQLTNAKDE